jgi:hypothetical protein
LNNLTKKKRKIKNIKEEVKKIWKTREKRIKQKHKTQWKATPADQNKWKKNLRT